MDNEGYLDQDVGDSDVVDALDSSSEIGEAIEYEDAGFDVVDDADDIGADFDADANESAHPEASESPDIDETELPPIVVETEDPDLEVIEEAGDLTEEIEEEPLSVEVEEPAVEEETEIEEELESDYEEPADADDSGVSEEIESAVEIVRGMDQLDPETWEAMDADERTDTLQELEYQMAGLQDRPATEIVPMEMEAGTYGGYQDGIIYINENDLGSDMPVDEFIDTVVHEGRHVHQEWSVMTSDPAERDDEVALWADNMEEGHYLDPERYGQELYESQPVEDDAAQYAGQIRNLSIATNEF